MAYHGPPSEIELYPLPFLATIRYYSQRYNKLIPSPKVDRDKLCVVIPRRCASRRFLLRLLPWPCFSTASVPPDDLWEFNATKVFTEQREFFIRSPSYFLRLTACHAFERTTVVSGFRVLVTLRRYSSLLLKICPLREFFLSHTKQSEVNQFCCSLLLSIDLCRN